MSKLNDENIRSLIGANQTAIKQLEKDITKMTRNQQDNINEFGNAVESIQRDIQDRWEYLSDMTKEVEKIYKEMKRK